MKRKVRCCTFLGIILGFLALGATIIAFATDHWVDITSKGGEAKQTERREKHTRHYGILKECFPAGATIPDDVTTYEVTHKSILNETCFYIDYHIPPQLGTELTTKEWTRVHLMRTTFGLMISAIFLLFICLVLALYSCCTFSTSLHRSITFLICISAFFIAAAVALFHGKFSMEQTEINKSSVEYASGREREIYMYAYKSLGIDVTIRYSWSYMLAWVGCGLAWIAAILFCCSGRHVDRIKELTMGYHYPAQSTSSMVPLEYAQYGPSVVKTPLPILPPEDYYLESEQMYARPPILASPAPPATAPGPYDVVEEYYTPDGKLVSTAPAATENGTVQYVDPRLMKKY